MEWTWFVFFAFVSLLNCQYNSFSNCTSNPKAADSTVILFHCPWQFLPSHAIRPATSHAPLAQFIPVVGNGRFGLWKPTAAIWIGRTGALWAWNALERHLQSIEIESVAKTVESNLRIHLKQVQQNICKSTLQGQQICVYVRQMIYIFLHYCIKQWLRFTR